MFRKVLAILFLCCVALVVQAQPDTDEQLAKQFFDNREFDKSAILYEKLFDKAPLQEYFEGYLESVLAQNDFKTAEKFIKKQIKRNPGNHTLAVHLGYVYKLSGADDKSKKQIELINNLLLKKVVDSKKSLSKTELFFKSNGGNETINVGVNLKDYSVNLLPSWCTVEKYDNYFIIFGSITLGFFIIYNIVFYKKISYRPVLTEISLSTFISFFANISSIIRIKNLVFIFCFVFVSFIK